MDTSLWHWHSQVQEQCPTAVGARCTQKSVPKARETLISLSGRHQGDNRYNCMNTLNKFHGNDSFPLPPLQQCYSVWFSHSKLQLVGPTGHIQLFLESLLVSVALLLLDLQWDPTFVLGQLKSNLGRNLCCMDVFVTYVLGVDFAPPISLRTYYRLKTAAESMRVWKRCPLLLVRSTCVS